MKRDILFFTDLPAGRFTYRRQAGTNQGEASVVGENTNNGRETLIPEQQQEYYK